MIAFTNGNIGWQAHIGGLLGGAAFTAAMVYAPQEKRLAFQLAAAGGMLVLLVAVVALRTSSLA